MTAENQFDTSGQNQPNLNSGDNSININTINDYLLIEQSFFGTAGFKNGKYLVPHKREIFYDDRRIYSPYVNYIHPIIKAMYEPVFAEPFMREHKNDLYLKFEKNATGNNTSLDKFINLCLKFVRMHSVVFIIVDNHTQTEVSRKQAIAKNEYPYTYIKKAYELNNDGVTFSDLNVLTSIMFYDHCELDSEGNTIKFYRYWDKKQTIIYKLNPDFEGIPGNVCNGITDTDFNKKYTKEGEPVIHDLGEIPVYVAYEEIPDNPQNLLPVAARYGLMRVNHTIFNQDSEGRNLERDQGFSILAIPADDAEDADLNVGVNNYITFPPESRLAPSFLSPDSKLLQALLEKRMSMQEALIAIADQSGVQGITKSKNAKSGLAYAFEFFAYEATLIKSSNIAEEIEVNIRRLVNLWTGEKVEYDTPYPKNFKPNQKAEIHSLQNELLEMGDIPNAFKKKVLIEKFKLMYPNDKEGLEELIKELDSKKDPELNQDKDDE